MNKKAAIARFAADFVIAAGISTGGYLFGQSILNTRSRRGWCRRSIGGCSACGRTLGRTPG